jgi:putative hydrolase of the HAD superfamily
MIGPSHSRLPLAVVFDLDDTLYLERHYVRGGYAAVAQKMAENSGDANVLAQWMWERFLAGSSARMFDAANEHFALHLDPAQLASLVEAYRCHRPRIEPEEEAARAMAALAPRAKLGLLSDGFLPAQQLKLEALHLASAFTAVVFTEALGRQFWKPDPAGFRLVAERLGVSHADCAYVADNLSKDFVAPNALGWRTVLWRRPGQIHTKLAAPAGGTPQMTAHDHLQLLVALGWGS